MRFDPSWAQARSVAARSLTFFISQLCKTRGRKCLRKPSSVSGEVHGNFVACLFLGRGSSPQP